MTQKEKAEELVNKYTTVLSLSFSKEFALIAVDEILNSRKEHLVQSIKFYEYWTEVKKEIKKL